MSNRLYKNECIMEITKHNFNEKLSEVLRNINECTFIGFDAEFSSILSDECFKYRLFDTNEERYDKMRNVVSQMIMSQVGLTLLKYERESGAYRTSTYTFHLRPQAFAHLDQSFVFQASTLDFLCRHHFDFNKFIYEGIPYLSLVEEQEIRQQLQEDSLISNLARSLDLHDEKLLQEHCSRVSKWLSQEGGEGGEGDALYLEVGAAGAAGGAAVRYLLHRELRRRFPRVRTATSLARTNTVVVYRDEAAAAASGAGAGAGGASDAQLAEELVAALAGFSAVVAALRRARAPLVGHNLFLDLVLLHAQFLGPLPPSYRAFKRSLHRHLPALYDTKHISRLMQARLTRHEVWRSNSLQDLYEFFKEGKCRRVSGVASPIQCPWGEEPGREAGAETGAGALPYHHAGFDSYCTAYVCARLGQWAAREARGGGGAAVSPPEMFAALQALPALNRVHLIRSATPYLDLAGEDPKPQRPRLIYVESTEEPINVATVAALLAGFGSVDVKPLGTRAALVAAATHHTAERILARFGGGGGAGAKGGGGGGGEYRACAYSPLRHSPRARRALWGGLAAAALAGAGGALLLLRAPHFAAPAPAFPT